MESKKNYEIPIKDHNGNFITWEEAQKDMIYADISKPYISDDIRLIEGLKKLNNVISKGYHVEFNDGNLDITKEDDILDEEFLCPKCKIGKYHYGATECPSCRKTFKWESKLI